MKNAHEEHDAGTSGGLQLALKHMQVASVICGRKYVGKLADQKSSEKKGVVNTCVARVTCATAHQRGFLVEDQLPALVLHAKVSLLRR